MRVDGFGFEISSIFISSAVFFLNNLNSRRAVSRCIFVCFLSYIFFWIFGGLVSKSRKLNAFDGLDIVI